MRKVLIDLRAIAHNLGVVKRLARGARIIAVVKSDAYGHGMVEVARILAQRGVWGLGLAELGEVERLKKEGIGGHKLLMAGVPWGEERDAVALGAHIAVYDTAQLTRLDAAARALGSAAYVHVKVETGMGRLGFWPEEAFSLLRSRNRWPNVRFAGLFTHLSSADDPEDPLNVDQIDRITGLVKRLRGAGVPIPMVHVANSAALFHFPQAVFQGVRPGIALYGGVPFSNANEKDVLVPAMQLTVKVISVKRLPPGHPVGYSHTYTTDTERMVAVLPIGYDDGYLRSLSNRAQVLIHGRRCPVIGNICMRATMVDVTGLPRVEPGTEAVLLGKQGDDTITPWELAQWAGTISYELLCLLGTRNPRRFVGAV